MIDQNSNRTTEQKMDIYSIMENLEHRNQFLMVDKVIDMSDSKIITRKNITATEPFFLGHFPDRPVFPGALIIESMAQSCGLLIRQLIFDGVKAQGYLVEVDKVKFFHVMIPGDIMTIEAELTERVMKYFKFSCLVTSESKKIAKGKITLLINKK